MDYITIKEAAEKWQVSTRTVQRYINAGIVDGAIKLGRLWVIPKTTTKPGYHLPVKVVSTQCELDNHATDNVPFKYPIYYYTEYFIHPEKLNPLERKLWEGQRLLLQGDYKEAYSALKEMSVHVNDEPVFFQVGLYYSLIASAFANADISNVFAYCAEVEKLFLEDFAYKKDLELLYPIFKGKIFGYSDLQRLKIDPQYNYHKDTHPIIMFIHMAQYTLSIDKFKELNSNYITFAEVYLNSLEAEGKELLAIDMHISLTYIYGVEKNLEYAGMHLRKAVALAVKNNVLHMLLETQLILGKRFTKILSEYDYQASKKLLLLYKAYLISNMKLTKYNKKDCVYDLLNEDETFILYGVTIGLTNKQIAELNNVKVSTISNKLSNIYAKTGIKSRSQVKDFVIKYSKDIFINE